MTITTWVVLLYAIAGGCGLTAALWAFAGIGSAAKKSATLAADPYGGNRVIDQLNSQRRAWRSLQEKEIPSALMLLGKRWQRITVGSLVVASVLAGTAADILATIH